MQRRTLIKNMATVTGGLFALPSWARSWSREAIPNVTKLFSPQSETLLADVVATIIPATDTPGAKELGVDALIKKILADCYEKETQEMFEQGLNKVNEVAKEKYTKTFSECNQGERLEILRYIEKEEKAAEPSTQNGRNEGVPTTPTFFRLAKELTILGYTNSEYVMTNLTNYVATPGHYYGCVPYTKKA